MEVAVEKRGACVVVRMKRGENRINPEFLSQMNEALDKAESYEDATCMVTVGEGKHYSLGLDLDFFTQAPIHEITAAGIELQKLLSRLLTFPLVTVAAVNGHAYAAGAFLPLVHDYTIMRRDRGWFCLPEINIKRNFTVGLLKILRAKIPPREQVLSVALGQRYTAEEAHAAGIIHQVSPLDLLEEAAIAEGQRLAGADGLDRKVLASIKHDLYYDIYKSLNEPIRLYSVL